jgi:hypothetical protein
VIDGNLLVKGTVTLDAIKSGSTIGTSNVSFGLGVSWGPGTAVSGGYFHSTSSAQFALVCDNVAGGYSIASATTATNDSGAAFVGGGGWTGYTTSGGVTSAAAPIRPMGSSPPGRLAAFSATALQPKRALGKSRAGPSRPGAFRKAATRHAWHGVELRQGCVQHHAGCVSLGTSSYAVDITAGHL